MADDNEVTLNCTNSITIVGTSSYGTDGSAYSNLIRLNSYAAQGGAGAVAFTLDGDWDASKVKSAKLQLYVVSKPNKNRTGSIYIKSLNGYPNLSSNTNTSYSDGKHIVYSETSSTSKRYTFSGTTQATVSASAYTSVAPAQGSYFDVDLTTYMQGLSTKSAGDLVYFGIDISDWAFDTQLGAYGYTYAPKLVITYTSETLYTATFTANSGAITPTVTIYSDAGRTSTVTNGTLLNGTKYYYRAVLEGYQNCEGDFTVSGTNPSVSFTMTAKTPVTSMKVNYTYGGSTIYTDNQSVTGLYVGESYTAPFHMYIVKDGALYKTTAEGSDPYYGKTVTLEANTAVEKSLTLVNLYGGTIALFEDLDAGTGDNAGIRASYCSSYGNMAYTSTENLEAGTYTFIFRGQNKDRGSSVKVGETEIIKASDISNKNTWGDKTVYNVNIPSAGKLTLVKGGNNTIDYYDIIIAIKQTGDIVNVTNAGYATYVSTNDLDFSATSIKAYKVKVSTKGIATLTKVDNVPADTPVLLYKDGGAKENIPFAASADAVTENDLVAGTNAAVATTAGDYTNMILWTNATNPIGFYFANGQTVAANRAYLHIATSLAPDAEARMAMVFGDDEVTGVHNLNVNENLNNEVYDLQGRRVMNAQKGLYIVNGKKVVIK